MSTWAVPSELTDAVIDHVQLDKQSLANCSVVCRAWLPRSRHHLFDRIHLSPESFIRWFDPKFGSPLAVIAPYVRILLLHDGLTAGPSTMSCPKASNDMLSQLSIFTALESLHILNHCGILEATEDVRNRFLSGFVFLKTLRIRHFGVQPLNQIVTIPAACPNLEIFSLDFVCGLPSMEERLSSPIMPSHLRNLRLSMCDKGSVLDWLLSAQIVPPVEVLCLKEVNDTEIPSVGIFLRTLGPSLKCVKLGFDVVATGHIESALTLLIFSSTN